MYNLQTLRRGSVGVTGHNAWKVTNIFLFDRLEPNTHTRRSVAACETNVFNRC